MFHIFGVKIVGEKEGVRRREAERERERERRERKE